VALKIVLASNVRGMEPAEKQQLICVASAQLACQGTSRKTTIKTTVYRAVDDWEKQFINHHPDGARGKSICKWQNSVKISSLCSVACTDLQEGTTIM